MTKKFFWGIFFSVTFLSGCSIIPNDNLIKWECDNHECSARTNILVCNKDNTHCEYIDVPILEEKH